MPKPHIPLAQPFSSRDGTLGVKDTFVQNGCLMKNEDKIYVVKRPGSTLTHDFATNSAPQGVTEYNSLVYAVYSDVLYRTGGLVGVGSTGAAWTQATQPTWYGRAFFTATVFQGRIYVIGGEASFLYADISYSMDGLAWSQNASAAPFSHRQGHGACVFNGQLWVMGGQQIDSTVNELKNDVWASSDGANWTQATASAAWSARVNFSLLAANNGMYVYGGEDTNGNLLDDVWYTTDGITWTNLTTAATGTARSVNAFMFFNNKLWIIGGDSTPIPGGTPINDVCSSPDGQTWAVTAPVFPTGKSLMAYTVYNNQMWLIGGNAGGTLVSDVWSSSDGLSWTLVTTTPGFTPRGGASAITFPTPVTVNQFRYQSMWLLGGNDGSIDLQEVWYGDLDLNLPTTFTLSPTVSSQPYQFNSFENSTQLLIKNQSNFWVLNAGVLTKVTDTNYPTVTVPGLVVINAFGYVMEPDGTIRGCSIDNALLWPSLQFVVADYEDDAGVAIAKYLNYLIAFGQYTTQFFYDAGNPAPGIPLSPYQSTNIKIGCAFAASVCSAKNTLIWMGQTKERNWGIFIFDGLVPKKVSTAWVDKVLNVNANSATKAFSTGMEGHTFYVLVFQSGQALTYDMDTQQWHFWDNDNAGLFPYIAAVSQFFSGGDLWFDTFGGVFNPSFEVYDDNGTAFQLRSQSDNVGDDQQRTFWGQANLYADLNPATATLEVSDDDYQTWTTWGTFDLSLTRPYLNRGGSARRRAFRLTQTDSNPARWVELRFNASGGES